MTTTTKFCTKCQERKSLEDFYRNRANPDGHQDYCKPCWKVQSEQSRVRHIEARRAKARETAQKARQTRPETIQAQQKKWYDQHGAEYFRDWQNQNRASVQEASRRWRANHPFASQVSGNNTRSRREGATGVLTEQEWTAILEKHEHQCASCGKVCKLEIDHITPIKLGGANRAENIQPLCHACNTRKSQQLLDYRRH